MAATVACSSVLAAYAWAATSVTTAADVCPGNPNPCNVTSEMDVTDGAVLDFGTRTVNVTGAGQFNFGIGSGEIDCGPFLATTTAAAIDAAGIGASGTQSGTVKIRARRQCSNPNPNPNNRACVDQADCQLGACDSRRCSLKSSRTCTADSDCQLGNCSPILKKCSGAATFVRCSTNADCQLGTCPAQLMCHSPAVALACSATSDCFFGDCSVGSASLTMNGPIAGNSDFPANIELRAADSVSISKPVNLNSSNIESDGGDLTVEAASGSISITAKVTANAGGDSQGGSVELDSATDITIGAEIDVIGGDFDGGSPDFTAGNDIVINSSVIANSAAGAGFGGDHCYDAGRDIVLNGASPTNKTTIESTGHTDVDNFAGDGGCIDFSTVRNAVLNANTRLIGNGSTPDGYGSDVTFDIGGTLTLNGDITAKALGIQGTGGFVDITSGGLLSVGSTGTFDVTGGNGGGGVCSLATDSGDITYGGFADASAGNGGIGGLVFLGAGKNISFGGEITVAATSGGGQLELDGCRLTLQSGSNVDNNCLNGTNTLKQLAFDNMKLLAGSSVTTGANGANKLIYRSAAKPPIISGTVSPAATKIVDPSLPGVPGCPTCGNGTLDFGETCDDGNTVSGDGCSSDCQNEKCIAQTPGYDPAHPNAVPLCSDGNACTADVCNTALNGGTCQHPAKNCSDNIDCTDDSCAAGNGQCLHVPNNTKCDDGNPCTDDFCSATGCGTSNNTSPCNDNNSCTTSDICANGTCTGTPVQGCGFCGDGNVNPPEQCDDGNSTFTTGEYCGVGCVLIKCGDVNGSGTITSSDALLTLKAAVGQITCSPRVCDNDASGKVTASDALRTLRVAVGQQTVTLTCPTS
ncbi:MAG TPA: hypothetical protein VGK20_12020 [Candidatus Binatia bacterium]